MSVLVCFYSDLVAMVREKKKRPMITFIVVGTVPAGLAGVFLRDHIDGALRSPWVIVFTLVFFGAVMYAADYYGKRKRGLISMRTGEALGVGVAQALALVPGVSRSGITMSAALARGFKRAEAARFSFLLSIPVIGGAAILEAPKVLSSGSDAAFVQVAAGFLSAFVTGTLTIKLLLAYLSKRGFGVFVVYRFMLAGVIAGWLWLAG